MGIVLFGVSGFALLEFVRRRAQERSGVKLNPLVFPSFWMFYPEVLPEEKHAIITFFVIWILLFF